MPSIIPQWIEPLFAAIDDRDADRFAEFLSPEVEFRFANAPPTCGREATRRFVAGFFDSIAAVRHRVDQIWNVEDGTVVCRGEVHYTRLDGSQLSAPFVNVFGIDRHGIREYAIYVDASAL